MLQKSLEPYRPDVLSDDVAHRAYADGVGIHAAADRLAIEAAPVSAHAKHMQPTAEAAAERRRKAESLDAELQSEIAYDHATQNMITDLAQYRTNIEAGKFRFSQTQADVAGFEAAFSDWAKNPWNLVCERVNSTLVAREMLVAFPRWIDSATKAADALEAEINQRVAARKSRN